MTIRQVKTGWQVDIQPGGRSGRRIKKTFKTKAEALAWERHVQAKVQETPDWAPAKKDLRKLSELIEIWHRNHGHSLQKDTHRSLLVMCEAMGNPVVEKFTADLFADYRARRIESGVMPNSANREHAYMRAMFNELIRLGHWKRDNPLQKLRAFKVQEKELSYLTQEQIVELLDAAAASTNEDLELICRIALATGARWSEAEGLRVSQIHQRRIQYAQTKSGRVRTVPISEALEKAIRAHAKRKARGERIFGTAYAAFRKAIERAKIELPAGQLSHVLRHSFASHFMMNGGNILTLQKILGHSDLKTTMRYAHMAPDHLEEAVVLNPVANVAMKPR